MLDDKTISRGWNTRDERKNKKTPKDRISKSLTRRERMKPFPSTKAGKGRRTHRARPCFGGITVLHNAFTPF
jgi:hypothetical protein